MSICFDSDQDVIKEVLGGNMNAYEKLVIKYRMPLFRLGLKLIGNVSQVEDILQDTFIKAYKSLNHFQGRSSFKSWLYQIFMNTLRNSLRIRQGVPIENVLLSTSFTGDQLIEKSQMNELIQKVIQSLPQRQQTAVILRLYEELSFEEISKIMQCPYDTAKANYRHGILKLREMLEAFDFNFSDNTKEEWTLHTTNHLEEAEI